jgi:SNF2 family DNA or RNA helicase
MGLDKTLLGILVMALAAKERGCFSLMVCPAATKQQWAREIYAAYKR